MKTVAFIPIKLNNERTPGKNIRPLSDGTPLCHLIQQTLLQVEEIDEIVVYCSNEKIKEYLLPGVQFLKRPESLDTSTTKSGDILKNFLREKKADIYVLTHVTCPFTKAERFKEGIQAVREKGYDSAFAAQKIAGFLWKDGEPLNFTRENIPRTQDMPSIYQETTSFYVFTMEVFEKYRGRTGGRPYLCECSAVEALDIDYPEDFEMADAVYTYLKHNRKLGI